VRTVSASAWSEAQAAWIAGEFSDEWKPWRHKAAMDCGIVYPPSGTNLDSWEDDSPSQRAILIRAIREQPGLLSTCFRGSKSWSDIIGKLTRRRDEIREDSRALLVCREVDDVPSSREAAKSLQQIIQRIADS
jgi:hypothetical protein